MSTFNTVADRVHTPIDPSPDISTGGVALNALEIGVVAAAPRTCVLLVGVWRAEMIVEVRADRSVTLLEAEDTGSFRLVVPHEWTETDLARALAGVADVAAGYAWVSPSWIREQSPLAISREWQASFAKMLNYARSRNWIRDTDGAIRAHIEKM